MRAAACCSSHAQHMRMLLSPHRPPHHSSRLGPLSAASLACRAARQRTRARLLLHQRAHCTLAAAPASLCNCAGCSSLARASATQTGGRPTRSRARRRRQPRRHAGGQAGGWRVGWSSGAGVGAVEGRARQGICSCDSCSCALTAAAVQGCERMAAPMSRAASCWDGLCCERAGGAAHSEPWPRCVTALLG